MYLLLKILSCNSNCYFFVVGLSFLIPHTLIDIKAPFYSSFKFNNVSYMAWISSVTTIVITAVCTFNTIYVLQRLMYSMGRDAVLPGICAWVEPRTQVSLYFKDLLIISHFYCNAFRCPWRMLL